MTRRDVGSSVPVGVTLCVRMSWDTAVSGPSLRGVETG